MGSNPSSGRANDDEDEGVVRPEELDFTEDESVAEIRDGQYVIATDDRRPNPDGADDANDDDGATNATVGDESRSAASPHDSMYEYVADARPRHGVSLTVSIDGDVSQTELFSDDLDVVFREFLSWYARQVDDETPQPEVLGILLMASDLQVRYPGSAIAEYLTAHELGPDDTIRDLVDAIRDDGFYLPPET